MPSAARVYKQRRTAAREICVFLAELGNGQPLALGGEGVKDLQPAARDSIKLGSCSACLALSVLGILSLIASFSVAA